MAKDKKGKGSGTKDACYHKVKSRYSVWPSAYASGALVKCRKVGAKNWGNKSESFEVQEGRPMYDPERVKKATSLPQIDTKKHRDASKQSKINNMKRSDNPNERKVAEKKLTPAAKVDTPVTRTNKIREFSKNTEPTPKPKGPKLMGEGKYSKSETYVKGTAPVRATYGGKTESFPKETYKKKTTKTEELNVELDEAPYQVYGSPDGKKEKKIGKPVKSKKYAADRAAELEDTHKKTGGKYRSEYVEEVEQIEEKKKSGDPCWVGYKQVGMKKKGAKMVPNCVPEETEVEEGYKPIDKDKENKMYRRAGNLARTSLSSKGKKKLDSASKSAKIVSAISRQKENERFDKMADIKVRDNYTEEVVQSILEKCWAGYEKKGMKTMFGKRYPNCVKKKATRKEEVEVKESDSAFEFVKNELIKKHGAAAIVGTPENKAATAKRKAEAEKNKKKPAPDTRTDAQKMTDATGPRPGSRYRGD